MTKHGIKPSLSKSQHARVMENGLVCVFEFLQFGGDLDQLSKGFDRLIQF